MAPYLACPACGQAGIIADTRGGRWCWRCTAQLLTDVRRLQALDPAALGVLVAMLRDAGAASIATAVVGVLPGGENE